MQDADFNLCTDGMVYVHHDWLGYIRYRLTGCDMDAVESALLALPGMKDNFIAQTTVVIDCSVGIQYTVITEFYIVTDGGIRINLTAVAHHNIVADIGSLVMSILPPHSSTSSERQLT